MTAEVPDGHQRLSSFGVEDEHRPAVIAGFRPVAGDALASNPVRRT